MQYKLKPVLNFLLGNMEDTVKIYFTLRIHSYQRGNSVILHYASTSEGLF